MLPTPRRKPGPAKETPATEKAEARAKEQGGRVDCPSCNNSLAWDEVWTGNNECKYCGYAGKIET